MSDIRDFTGKNRKFTGTNSIRLPNGTTAQRIGSEAGEIRFNTTLGLAEYYTGTAWKAIDAPPAINGVSVDSRTATATSGSQYVNTNAGGTVDIVITGSGFDDQQATVTIVGVGGSVTPTATTIDSTTQITVTCTRSDFSESFDPYTIRVTNPSLLFAELTGIIDAQALPVFATAAGSLGEVYQNAADPSLSSAAATDADGDTITYSIVSGAIPSGMSFSTSTAAITGTPDTIELASFTVRAATTNGNVDRAFTINVVANPFVIGSGGTETTDGDFKVHTFTSPGTFTVSNTGTPSGSTTVEYLIVAGGGSGAQNCGGGGGGAGGYRTNYPAPGPTGGQSVSATSYPVSVGGGGSGLSAQNSYNQGSNGSTSSVFSITSAGGGGGGQQSTAGNSGGSGGGGGHNSGGGGSGNQPPVSPPQGNPGGASQPAGYTSDDQGGGGGGASQAGSAPNGFGGAGSPNAISGSAVTYAGGGGGGHRDIPNTDLFAPGGAGGGGRGGNGSGPSAPDGSGRDGTTNTGGGGGGGCRYGPYPPPPGFGAQGSGGSGIVIIRYKYQ